MAPRIRAPLSLVPESCLTMPCCSAPAPLCRAFSTTPCLGKMTKARFKMYTWLNSLKGRKFQDNVQGYCGPLPDQPFPLNPLFRSLPVLSDEMREHIWKRVVQDKVALKVVSADMDVDVRRVAAVVRLKQVEKQWLKEGKPLAIPYAKAMERMVPQADWSGDGESQTIVAFENINEVRVLPSTKIQLFLPVSESRHFTREDAAKAFRETLPSADKRSAHRQLIAMDREVIGGQTRKDSYVRFVKAAKQEEIDLEAQAQARREREERKLKRVPLRRCEWRIKNVRVNGAHRKRVGVRYGAPFDDREDGKIKIPTYVD